MKTLEVFLKNPPSIPPSIAWYLSDLGEAKGKQDLFTHQSPQKLKVLKEYALIESVVSSNRIEGVEIPKNRINPVILGRSHLRDRNEEEIRGYRKALDLIHQEGMKLRISKNAILDLHKLIRGDIWDAGEYKNKDSHIIERYADNAERIRFKTVSAKATPSAMKLLLDRWDETLKEKNLPSLISLAAFNLDFLCIHPFRDGNGRVSRLLMLLQSYHLGFEVGRFISLERLIEENKDRYYETLEESSRGWHEKKHDPWPYIAYVLFILKSAYKEFEQRISALKYPRGEKTNLILEAIQNASEKFSVADIQAKCPSISVDMIRKVLFDLRQNSYVKCLGRGKHAKWSRTKKYRISIS